MTTQITPRRIDGWALDEIIAQATIPGRTPAQILERMKENPDSQGRILPSLRTVERIVKELRASDEADPWNIDDTSSDSARVVLDVLRDLIFDGHLSHPRISKAAARWVVRIRGIVPSPELDSWAVWLLAQLYRSRVEKGLGTDDLDCYLAFRPWQDTWSYSAYHFALDRGLFPRVPLYQILVENQNPDAEFQEKKIAMIKEEGKVTEDLID